jgi:hypothetical protein
MERIPTDPTRPRAPAPMALLSLAGVLGRARADLERIAREASEIEGRAKVGEINSSDVARLAGMLRNVALSLLSINALAALVQDPPPPAAPVNRWRRAWRVLTGRE